MDQKAALKALEANIIEACTNHELVHRKDKNYRACVSIGTDYFVKFGNANALWPELQTQSYIFDYARSTPHPDTPRIPQVVHHFKDRWIMYLVMEFITLTTDAHPDLIDRTKEALVWLSGVPPPPNHVIGPLGGGRILHDFFQDGEAPLLFSSVDALQRYMHEVRLCFRSRASTHRSLTCNLGQAHKLLSDYGQKHVSPVEMGGDRLMFTQSDMDPSNFGVDQHGKTVLMDFGRIGVLPETFVAYTMSGKRFAPIANALGLSDSSTYSMAVVSPALWIIADPRLSASASTSYEILTNVRHRPG